MTGIDKIVEIKSDDIDVKKIMEDIQRRAREKRDKEIAFPSGDELVQKNNYHNEKEKPSQDDLFAINTNHHITSYYEFKSNRLFGCAIVFAKKVLRKVLFAIVEVPFQKLTIFNSHVTRYLNSINICIESIQSDIELIRREKNENSKQIYELKREQKESLQQIDGLKQGKRECLKQTDELKEKQKDSIRQINEIRQKFDQMKELKETLENLCINVRNNNATIDKQTNKIIEFERKFSVLEEKNLLDSRQSTVYKLRSCSQSGEDSIVNHIFANIGVDVPHIKYIDIGANYPIYDNNTYYFYQRGARGVLVEANPNLISDLKFYRNGDIILNNCVDICSNENRTFYISNIDGLSSMDYQSIENAMEKNIELKIIDEKVIKTITINDIIDTYLGQAPDMISIDVEGKDFEILKSINYNKYRPKVIVVETISYDIKLAYRTKNDTIVELMKEKGYDEYAFTGINSIFIDSEIV